MTLEEMFNKVSNREYLLCAGMLEREWNRPSRSDHYLMMLGRIITCLLHSDPQSVKIGDFKLVFDFFEGDSEECRVHGRHRQDRDFHREDGGPDESTFDQEVKKSKAVWRSRMGGIGGVRVLKAGEPNPFETYKAKYRKTGTDSDTDVGSKESKDNANHEGQ